MDDEVRNADMAFIAADRCADKLRSPVLCGILPVSIPALSDYTTANIRLAEVRCRTR